MECEDSSRLASLGPQWLLLFVDYRKIPRQGLESNVESLGQLVQCYHGVKRTGADPIYREFIKLIPEVESGSNWLPVRRADRYVSEVITTDNNSTLAVK